MKKLRFVWIILSIAAMLASVAAAPFAGSALTLIEVRNDKHGDVIFVFSVSGHFSRSELKGYVEVQGEDANYDLSCSQVDDVTVQCTTSRKTGGKNVVVFFGGSVFWAHVPPTVAQYCYNVYDLPYPLQGNAMVVFTVYCQDAPANFGDVIDLYNPAWEITGPFIFLPESPQGCERISENAYYWPQCAV